MFIKIREVNQLGEDLFEVATIEQMKKGYIEEQDQFTCILCEHSIEKGIIYQKNDVLYEAEKFMQYHIQEKHGSVFDYFIQLNKKMTGLTEHQSNLLKAFYEGQSDQEIQKNLEIGSVSTIRQHRFALREKEKQAKTLLTLMALLKEREDNPEQFVPIHRTATMVDDRFNITKKEEEEVLKRVFPNGLEGELIRFPKKQKHKIIVLRAIAATLDQAAQYSEKQLNEHISKMYEDYVTIRRYLIEYGFLDRENDGSAYWVKK